MTQPKRDCWKYRETISATIQNLFLKYQGTTDLILLTQAQTQSPGILELMNHPGKTLSTEHSWIQKYTAFFLIYFSYASMFSIRASWAFISIFFAEYYPFMRDDTYYISLTNTVSLISLAAGHLITPYLFPQLSKRLLLGFSYIVLSLLYMAIPYLEQRLNVFWLILVFMALHSLVCGVTLQTSFEVLYGWFMTQSKQTVLGVFSSSTNIGILIGICSSETLHQVYGLYWKVGFYFNSLFCLLMGLCLLIGLNTDSMEFLEQGSILVEQTVQMDIEDTNVLRNLVESDSFRGYSFAMILLRSVLESLVLAVPNLLMHQQMFSQIMQLSLIRECSAFFSCIVLGIIAAKTKQQDNCVVSLLVLGGLSAWLGYFFDESINLLRVVMLTVGLMVQGPSQLYHNRFGFSKLEQFKHQRTELEQEKKKVESRLYCLGAVGAATTQALLGIIGYKYTLLVMGVQTIAAAIIIRWTKYAVW